MSYFNRVWFNVSAGGLADFTVGNALIGFRTPAQASVPDHASVVYTAETADRSQWEIGDGVYHSDSGTVERVSVHESTNGGAKVNFSTAPSVWLDFHAQDIHQPGGNDGQLQFNDAGSFGGLTVGGDATLDTDTGTLTIADGAITLAKMQHVSTSRVLGRVSGGAGDVEELTGTQLTALLNTFTSILPGSAPASGGGSVNFLRADGSWAEPTSPPGGSQGQVQWHNTSDDFAGMSGTSWDDTNRSLTLTGAAITADHPVLDLTQEWNNAAVAFTALRLNVTNTQSHLGSALLDLRIGGVSGFQFARSSLAGGDIPSLMFGGGRGGSGVLTLAPSYSMLLVSREDSATRGARIGWNANQISAGSCIVDSDGAFCWTNGAISSIVYDAVLRRDGDGIIAQRNGASAQAFRVYKDYTDASNFARLAINGNQIASERAGSGSLEVTASAPVLDLAQTWNNAAAIFTGLKLQITNTASAANSRLLTIGVGATTFFDVAKDPTYASTPLGCAVTLNHGAGTVGFGTPASQLGLYVSGNWGAGPGFLLSTYSGISQLTMGAGAAIGWQNLSTVGWTGYDTAFFRDAAGNVGLRNGANAQAFRVYRTYTDGSNYERAALQTGSGYVELAAQTAGTGADNLDIRLTPAGTGRVKGPIGARVSSAAAGDINPDVSVADFYVRTALTAGITIGAPGGSPQQGDRLTFRLKDDGSERSLTWNAIYRAIAPSLPAQTVANKTMFVAAIFNETDSRWDVVAVQIDGVTGGVLDYEERLFFPPAANEPPASNYATLDTRNGHPVLDFDDTTAEAAVFTGVLPRNYNGNGLTAEVAYSMTSATSGTCGWTLEIERIGDGQLDVDGDSFGPANTVAAVTVPATSGNVDVAQLVITDGGNIDYLAAGEQFRVRLKRDVANDTAAGDAELHWLAIRET